MEYFSWFVISPAMIYYPSLVLHCKQFVLIRVNQRYILKNNIIASQSVGQGLNLGSLITWKGEWTLNQVAPAFEFRNCIQSPFTFPDLSKLGDTQYIVWTTRSSNVKKICPTRKKNWQHFLVFFIFSSDAQEKQ